MPSEVGKMIQRAIINGQAPPRWEPQSIGV